MELFDNPVALWRSKIAILKEAVMPPNFEQIVRIHSLKLVEDGRQPSEANTLGKYFARV